MLKGVGVSVADDNDTVLQSHDIPLDENQPKEIMMTISKLNAENSEIIKVCFLAPNEESLIKEGWAGLAKLALKEVHVKYALDDINVYVNESCTDTDLTTIELK